MKKVWIGLLIAALGLGAVGATSLALDSRGPVRGGNPLTLHRAIE